MLDDDFIVNRAGGNGVGICGRRNDGRSDGVDDDCISGSRGGSNDDTERGKSLDRGEGMSRDRIGRGVEVINEDRR